MVRAAGVQGHTTGQRCRHGCLPAACRVLLPPAAAAAGRRLQSMHAAVHPAALPAPALPTDSPTCSVDLVSGVSPSRPGCQHDANTRCALCDLSVRAPVRDADWTALVGALFRASKHDSAIFALALPAVLALAADPLLSMVDTVFVGRAGTDALAALGVNSALFTLAFVVFNFLATATTCALLVLGWAGMDAGLCVQPAFDFLATPPQRERCCYWGCGMRGSRALCSM